MPEDTDATHPGEHWKEEIGHRGSKQADVAAAIGCSAQFLSNIVRGHRMPGLYLTIAFGRYLYPDDVEKAQAVARYLWRMTADYQFDVALSMDRP